MKAIMISIQPKWVAKILNGEKTIEIRKTMPKCDLSIDVYIYCTKDEKNLLHKNCANIYWVEDKDFNAKNKKLGLETQPYLNGKVVAKFTLNKVSVIHNFINGLELTKMNNRHISIMDEERLLKSSCLNQEELYRYGGSYAWHISKLEIFNETMELSEFQVRVFPNRKGNLLTRELTKAPQSYCFIETGE